MAELDEFGLIERLFAPLARGYAGALDLKDDAALVACLPGERLAVTTDAIVGGVHFLPDDPPERIAKKLVRVNLSDLAAMGAKPEALFLAACFPRQSGAAWVERFAAGLAEDVAEFNVPLIGGDTCSTPGPATFSLTAMGSVAIGRELRRSTAKAGDRIWVSGTIGDGAFGLLAAQGAKGLSSSDSTALIERYQVPRPRLALGQALIGVAHAAIDVSDGLVADLGHICETSHLGAKVAAEAVPLSAAARAAIAAGLGAGLETVLTGGDDYELLFTAPESADNELRKIAQSLGLSLTPIGRMTEGQGVEVETDGGVLRLARRGYRHFGT